MIRLKELRKRLKKTQADIAGELNLSVQVISRYELGDREADYDTLKKIADYFSVSTDYLLGRTPLPIELRHLKFNDNVEPIDLTREVTFGKVPILGEIAAGNPTEAIENNDVDDYIFCDTKRFGDKLVFGLKIKGSSMEPRICDGDVAIIEICDWVESGTIAAVRVNGAETTLKTVKFEKDGMWLIGSNPSFKPLFYTANECAELPVTVIGRLLQVIQIY